MLDEAKAERVAGIRHIDRNRDLSTRQRARRVQRRLEQGRWRKPGKKVQRRRLRVCRECQQTEHAQRARGAPVEVGNSEEVAEGMVVQRNGILGVRKIDHARIVRDLALQPFCKIPARAPESDRLESRVAAHARLLHELVGQRAAETLAGDEHVLDPVARIVDEIEKRLVDRSELLERGTKVDEVEIVAGQFVRAAEGNHERLLAVDGPLQNVGIGRPGAPAILAW